MDLDAHFDLVILRVILRVPKLEELSRLGHRKGCDFVIRLATNLNPVVYLFQHLVDASSILVDQHLVSSFRQLLQNEVKISHEL